MLPTILLLIGQAQVFVMNTPLQGSERMVVLSDAYRFGVGYHEVRALWILSRDHPNKMRDVVTGNNSPEMVALWEAECLWRARAYYLLDDAVNCPDMPVYRKLESLQELRQRIGDEAYFAGVMPAPFPNYKLRDK